MIRFAAILGVLLVAGAATAAWFMFLREEPEPAPENPTPLAPRIREEEPSREQLERAAAAAAGYLTRAVRADGSFDYRRNLNPRFDPTQSYNELRHAGTIYAMATHYQRTPKDASKRAILGAAAWLRSACLRPLKERPDAIGVWLDPELAGRDGEEEAKLGGAGLALVALLTVEKIQPGFTPENELHGLGRFILFMQRDDGSFYSKYVPADGGRSDRWTSLYYPGEAALGMVLLYEHDPDPKWLRCAARAMAFLTHTRKVQSTVADDHWALLATARLLPQLNKLEQKPATREELVAHARQICTAILEDQVRETNFAEFLGAMNKEGRIAPTATRLEGLLAAATFLQDGPEREEILSAIRDAMAFLLTAQVRDGEFAGAFPRAVGSLPTGNRVDIRRATEVRIDYVQHALSAIMQYTDVMLD